MLRMPSTYLTQTEVNITIEIFLITKSLSCFIAKFNEKDIQSILLAAELQLLS